MTKILFYKNKTAKKICYLKHLQAIHIGYYWYQILHQHQILDLLQILGLGLFELVFFNVIIILFNHQWSQTSYKIVFQCQAKCFNIFVNFDFYIMKKLWDLAHEKLVNILGGQHVWTNIHGCQPYPPGAILLGKMAYPPKQIRRECTCLLSSSTMRQMQSCLSMYWDR